MGAGWGGEVLSSLLVSERIFCIESILLFVPGVSMNLIYFFYGFNAYDETAELLRGSRFFFYESPVAEEKH